MSGHTPESWSIHTRERYSAIDGHRLTDALEIRTIDGTLVCQVTGETNATLIVAAPDLLKELRYLADILSHSNDRTVPVAEWERSRSDALVRARAAIAKAEGR